MSSGLSTVQRGRSTVSRASRESMPPRLAVGAARFSDLQDGTARGSWPRVAVPDRVSQFCMRTCELAKLAALELCACVNVVTVNNDAELRKASSRVRQCRPRHRSTISVGTEFPLD
jgi:hypothetical protein